jgi:tetratricopeptide (TPR) repeat protein
LLNFAAVTTICGASQWIRLSSPNFDIDTDAGERTAAEILRRFETARRAFSPRDSLPVRVLAFSSEKDYAELRPAANVIGYYQSGPDRDYIVMQLAGPDSARVILHEYTHLVLNHNSAVLPQWLEEGLAEFFSTMTAANGRIRLGAPINAHLRLLRSQPWLDARELGAVDKNSPVYNEGDKTGLFYAQSWALAHMLYASPEYAGKLDLFSAALARGEPQERAFISAYGKTMERVVSSLRAYLEAPLPWVEVDGSTGSSGESIRTRALTEAETAETRAEAALASGKAEVARRLLDAVLRKRPDAPEALSGLATLALREKRLDDAARLFERAMAAGARDGRTLFEYAMVLRDTGGARERVTVYLQKAVAATPALAEAHFILGVRLSEDGRFDGAIEHLRRATEILPRQTYFWHALAYAHYQLENVDLSREAARRARNAARTEQEIKMAESALRLSDPSNAPVKKPAVSTPSSWENMKGDARVEGRLSRVDCGGTPRLHVGGMVLEVKQPGRVVIRGIGGVRAELQCGAQNVPVLVEFLSATLEVTAIEFR